MAKKVFPTNAKWHGEIFVGKDAWMDPLDDFAQQDRWVTLAEDEVWQDGKVVHSPLLNRGNKVYGAFQLRCAVKGCWAALGSVHLSPALWQGKPFVWAETIRITERKPKPVGRKQHFVLDAVTADAEIRSECIRHEVVSCSVSVALERLDKALDYLQKTGKTTPLELS